jgi:4-amino-4-deoxy-L-arabinose transferase-like glycosyltransferase
MWGREWVIATYKHPAMPSWVLEITRLATGTVGWPAYLVSQLFIAATFIFVYLLGRDLLGPRRAAAGTLLLTGISFYAWPTTEFNHNVAQLPFWAALPWALWRAVERKRIAWWALAGALAAGGIYAKLTTVLLLITLIAWILWDRDARRCLRAPGPWIGLVVFVALVAPLAQWLVAHDFAPLKYATTRSRMSQEGLHVFILSLFISVFGVLILLSIAGLIGPRVRAEVTGLAEEPPSSPVAARTVRYLIVVTTGPLALAVIGAAVSGSSLKVAWGSSMFNLAGILAIALTSRHFDGEALRRIAVCAGVLLIVLPLGYAVIIVAWPSRAGAPLRVNWPQAEISERFVDLWTRETGQPLRIVSGNRWIAGLVGVTAADNPSILSGVDLTASPWITPERLEREGMLVVWDARNPRMPRHLLPLINSRPVKEERFGWKPSIDGGDFIIHYAIIPPKQGQR